MFSTESMRSSSVLSTWPALPSISRHVHRADRVDAAGRGVHRRKAAGGDEQGKTGDQYAHGVSPAASVGDDIDDPVGAPQSPCGRYCLPGMRHRSVLQRAARAHRLRRRPWRLDFAAFLAVHLDRQCDACCAPPVADRPQAKARWRRTAFKAELLPALFGQVRHERRDELRQDAQRFAARVTRRLRRRPSAWRWR